MCEVNPTRAQKFVIEFFTSRTVSDDTWHKLVHSRLLELEYQFNFSGEVRVHVHEIDDASSKVEDADTEV